MTNRKRKISDSTSPKPDEVKRENRLTTKKKKKKSETVQESKEITVDILKVPILEGLRGLYPIDALKVFASSLESGGTEVAEFISQGGQAGDLLRLLQGDEKTKAPDVSVVFNAIETLFLYIAQGDEKCRSLIMEITQKILQDHMSYVMNLLSPTNTAYQAKSVLRMLTAMVACDAQIAREVLLKLDFEHKNFEGLLKRRSQDSAVDVRTSFVHLLIAFLIHGNTFVIKEFLEKRTKFTQIFTGLMYDSCTTVEFVMMSLLEKVVENPNLSKTSKMKLFSVYNLRPLLALFEWKGPRKLTSEEMQEEGQEEDDHKNELERVVLATKKFFMKILTSTKLGIVFHDPSCGNSGKNLNHLLLNLLQSISEPWRRSHLAELVISALVVSPDQVRPYLLTLEQFWAPRMSDLWFQLANFIRDLMQGLKWNEIVGGPDEKQPKLVISVLSNICFPEKMMRELIVPTLEDKTNMVRRKGMELLHTLTSNIVIGFKNVSDHVKKQVLARVLERLPSPKTLQNFWIMEVEDKEKDNEAFLLQFAETLDFLLNYYPQKYSVIDFDFPKMMQQLLDLNLSSSKGLSRIRLIFMKQLSVNKQIKLDENHLILLITAFVIATDEENKSLALNLLEEILLPVGLISDESYDLRVWLHYIPPTKSDEISELIAKCICAQNADIEVIKRKCTKLRKKYNAQSLDYKNGRKCIASFCPLTISLLENPLIRKFQTYLENAVVSLIAVQEDYIPFSTYVVDLGLNLNKPLKIIEATKKGRGHNELMLSSANSDNHQEDFFSIFLKVLQYLADYQRRNIKTHGAYFISLAALLEGHEQQIRSKVVNELLTTHLGKSLFHPFEMANEEASKFAIEYLLGTRSPAENDAFKKTFLDDCNRHIEAKTTPIDEGLLRSAFQLFSYTSEELSNIAISVLQVEQLSAKSLQLDICLLTSVFEHCVKYKIKMSQEMENTFQEKMNKKLLLVLNYQSKFINAPAVYKALAAYLQFRKNLCIAFPPSTMTECWKHIKYTEDFVKTLTGLHLDHAITFVQFITEKPEVIKLDLKNVMIVLSTMLGANHQLSKNLLTSLYSALKEVFKAFLNQGECEKKCDEYISRTIELLSGQYQCKFSDINPDFDPKSIYQMKGRLAVAKADDNRLLFSSFVLLRGIQFTSKNIKSLLNEDKGKEKAIELFNLLGECIDYGIDLDKIQLRGDNHDSWTQFVKVVLKYGLKGKDPELKAMSLKTLNKVCPSIYKETENDKTGQEEVQLITTMIFGHSCFMQIMLDLTSPHSSGKCELNKLILTLIKINPSICASSNIPIFLGAYHGTLSQSDQTILKILHHFEQNKVPLSQYYPIMFGPTAVSHYSVRQNNGTSLWKKPKTSEILSLVEPERMMRSAINFPLDIALNPTTESRVAIDDELTYDPRFFLALTSQICSPGVFVDRHLKLIESGILALSFGSLSSRDPMIRAVGYVCISRIFYQLETAKLTAEKRIWLHLIDMVRNGVRAAKNDHRLRIPSIVTVFLVRAAMILHSPLDTMYKAISNFVLAKPTLDLFNVPEFLRLFHSRELNHTEEQTWILCVIRDGMKDDIDFQIAQKDFIFKIIMTYHSSVLADASTKLIIRRIILNAVKMTQSAFALVKHHGLNLWIVAEMSRRNASDFEDTAKDMLEIMSTAYKTMTNSLASGTQLPEAIRYDFKLAVDKFSAKNFQEQSFDIFNTLRAQGYQNCPIMD